MRRGFLQLARACSAVERAAVSRPCSLGLARAPLGALRRPLSSAVASTPSSPALPQQQALSGAAASFGGRRSYSTAMDEGGRGGRGGRYEPRKWPEGTDPSEGKQIGAVKWFDTQKGFGFIVPVSGGEDLFVHQSDIHAPGFRSLMEGEEVEFKAVEDEQRGKMKAVDVTGPKGDFVQGAPPPPRGSPRD